MNLTIIKINSDIYIEVIILKWLRFTVLLVMAVLMFVFIVHEINQSQLSIWFILYFLLYSVVVIFWKPIDNKR
jgi:hypothetical protein